MLARLSRRYLDILASVYIYNEYRGYSSLDRVLTAVRPSFPMPPASSPRSRSTAPTSASTI
uniref:hypothetical protein n=1 Tax=Sphingomonas bacterium TaxID=1895847 RepID=UPI00262ADE4E|nr:hypothetical protein [Sphingomonas bacterium]